MTKTLNVSGRLSKYYLLITVILLAISTFVNAMLAVQLRTANTKLAKNEYESNLQPGERVPYLEALDLGGQPTTIRFSEIDRPTVLYIFSPSCGWCKKNVENIRTLAEGKSGEFDFIGISVSSEGLDEYVSENKWNFNVLRDVSDITRNSLKIGGTPQTIVLSKNGEVLKSWRGAYMSTVKDDVENFFGIRLPGIGGQ